MYLDIKKDLKNTEALRKVLESSDYNSLDLKLPSEPSKPSKPSVKSAEGQRVQRDQRVKKGIVTDSKCNKK